MKDNRDLGRVLPELPTEFLYEFERAAGLLLTVVTLVIVLAIAIGAIR